ERVARGRVWTGAAARERGLVDELGDVELAIDRCRQAARRHERERLDVVDVRPQPRAASLLRRLVAPSGPVNDALLAPLELYQLIRRGRAALVMPFWLRIR